MKTTSAILPLLALVFSLQAQTNVAPPATNPTVTLPPRITRTNMPEAAAPAPTLTPPPLTNVTTRPATNIAGPRVQPPAFRSFTNQARAATNVTLPTPPPVVGGRPPGVPGAVVPGGIPGAAPGAAPAGTAPSGNLTPPIDTPPSTLTALEPVVPGGPAEEVFPPGLIKFQDADITQVLDVYQELTGRTVMRPNNLPATKVTIRSQTPLTRKEAIQALDSILSLNGVSMIPQGEKFVKAVPATQAGTEAREFNELAFGELPDSGSLVAQVVRLTNALPRDVAQALQPFSKLPNSILGIDNAGILVLRDYAENVKRMMEVLEYIDVVPQQEFVDVVIPIKYALAGDIAQVIGSLTAGGGTTTVGRQQTRSGLTSGAGGFGGAGGAGGAGGLGGMNTPGSANYNPNQAGGTMGAGGLGSSTASRSSFADRLRGIVNQATQRGAGDIVILGTAKIIADERTNSLLIFASKSDLTTISNIIEKLDVVLPQVLIEAIIMEVSLGDRLDYGFSYLQRATTSAGDFTGIGAINNIRQLNFADFLQGGSNGLASGFSYVANIGDKFAITAAAAASDNRINILQRPRIQTSHAVEANLFVGRTRPYVTGQYYGYGGFGGGPQTQFQQQQIGVTLSVLPLINPDGLVVMDIRQRIQSIGADIPIDANFSVPETIDREANAKVSVRDRETIILGGFISNEKSKSKSGVPILKDIPLIGPLFSASQRRDDRGELIVMIRPTVLPNPQDAAIAAEEEKSKMPGVSVAEQEHQIYERKLLERAEREIKRQREKQ